MMKNFDEELIRLLDMGQRVPSRIGIGRVGPTDMGLIELALREGCVLFTDDEATLAPLALQHGVDCRLVRPMAESFR